VDLQIRKRNNIIKSIIKKAISRIKRLILIFFNQKRKRRVKRHSLSGVLPNKILIGTHHKTGTQWLLSIFSRISDNYSLKLHQEDQKTLPDNYDIFFHDHSIFNLNLINDNYKGIHIIRDPRDVIISGCFYHQKSEEKWLHVPRQKFNGLTYQQKINAYDKIDDKILFEMENSAARNLGKVMNWNYSNPNFLELQYENLIRDNTLVLFRRIFTFLGFPDSVIPDLLEIAYKRSLFSGQVGKSVHVRSGKPDQWKQYFLPIHKKRFLELFGNILIRLDYEKNNDWADV